jgi:hypothetical protein
MVSINGCTVTDMSLIKMLSCLLNCSVLLFVHLVLVKIRRAQNHRAAVSEWRLGYSSRLGGD